MPWHRRRPVRLAAIVLALVALAATPATQGLFARDGKAQAELQPGDHAAMGAAWASAVPTGQVPCTEGMAGPFPCEGVDLSSLVTIPEIGAALGSDVWGWHDDETGREIAIPTTTAGAAFVDVTDPQAPVVLGRITIGQNDDNVLWRDVKVYEDHAYVVSEHTGTHLVVFDLTRLRDVTSDQGLFEPDVVYDEFDNAHNIAINEDTGFAYVVGSNTCEGGLHMVDVRTPTEPSFAGCFAEDGYTHDVECVVYDGPDTDYTGREVCFASNEDTLTIVDVTDKDAPVMLSRTGYDTASYTHQGALTPDHRFFLFGDETDELLGTVGSTATYMTEVADLKTPGDVQTFLSGNMAIDHNLYIEDDRVWEANYTSGLRVFEYTAEGLRSGELTEVGFFDVFPAGDPTVFGGAWTAYPFFPSGTIVVNSFDTGLFVLQSELSEADPVDDRDEDRGDGEGRGQGPGQDNGRGNDGDGPGNGNGRGHDGDGPGNGNGRGDDGDETTVAAAAAQRPLPVTGGGAGALALLALAGAGAARRRRAG